MMETPRDPAASRYEHAAHGLRRADLDPDPIKQFSNWFTAAIEADICDVNAMSLATAGTDGKSSVRVVLLKGFDGRRVLDARMAEMTERFGDKPVPLPPRWGGYRVKPETMEFWQGRPNRLHDRFRYTRQPG